MLSLRPYERKGRTRGHAIRNASIPGIAIVPFLQHQGIPAEPVVRPGTRVREGMLIGRADSYYSAPVHAPIPGVVDAIRNVTLPDGTIALAAVISLDGEFDMLGRKPRLYPWEHLAPADILRDIADRGVVGLGGMGEPTHLKYALDRDDRIEALVLNGVECEPYLSGDHRLMIERTEELIEGLRIVEKLLTPRRVVIAVQRDMADAAAALGMTVSRAGLNFKILRVPSRYPQGDEKQLVRVVVGRDVPSGGTPRDVGVVVSNVGTVISVYEAVVQQRPVVDRVVTVAGRAVKNPANLKVRIGTPVAELIQECGGLVREPAKIVIGDPMMGVRIEDLSMPITKTTRGVLALTEDEVGSAQQTACIQCGRCVRSCPMGLEPTRLYKLIDHGRLDAANSLGIMDCRECGACSYVCPAHIPLVQWLKAGKDQIVKLEKKQKGTA